MSIEVRRVSKSFGNFAALRDVSLKVEPGELLAGEIPDHPAFRMFWPEARGDSFAPPPKVQAMRASKLT